MGSIELDRGTRWVFQRFLLCCPIVFMFTGFYRVLLGFLGFEWVRQRFDWVRMGSIEWDRDSVGVSKVSFVLPNQFYVHRAFEFYGFVCFFCSRLWFFLEHALARWIAFHERCWHFCFFFCFPAGDDTKARRPRETKKPKKNQQKNY